MPAGMAGKRTLSVALAAAIVVSSVFLSISPHIPSALAQYSWTDDINLYKDVSMVYTNIRKITNNETVHVDVQVYLTFTEKINLLEYYMLSANGTNFIIISKGNIVLSNGAYYGLEIGQALCFNIEAKGASLLSTDDIVKAGVRVEFWSAEYVNDIAITDITSSKTIVVQGSEMHIDVTVENQGNFTETFNIIGYANTTIIQTQTIMNLVSGESRTISITWNTTGVACGNYTISAVSDTVPYETDTSDNILSNGVVMVTIPGDVDVDGDVDSNDLYILATTFGTSPPGDPSYDINQDGVIDVRDLYILGRNYGRTDAPA
jgi:hypothetical protein